MKKSIFSYFSYLVLLLLAVGTLSSCDPVGEEGVNPAPSITVNPESAEVEVGQTKVFTYQVVSTESRLAEIRIIYPGQADQVITDFADNNLYSGTYSFTGQTADVGKTVTFNIEARDRDGGVSRKQVSVSVKAAVNPIAFSAFPAILVGGQDNSIGSYLNAKSGIVYKQSEGRVNSDKIDMIYLQGSQTSGQGAVIGSASDNSVSSIYNNATTGVQTWATRRATKFKNTSLSEAQFNAVADGSALNAAFAAGSQPDNNGTTSEGSKSRVNMLTAGKVFAFQTSDGKNGLVYVVSVNSGTTGDIRLNIKIVK